MPIVNIPGVGQVAFPDTMSDAEIASHAGRLHGDATAAQAQRATAAAPANDQPTSALGRFFAPILPSEHLSDYGPGLLHTLTHPGESLGLLKEAIARDPLGAVPVVGNVKRGVADVGAGNYAGAAGEGTSALLSLLGGAGALEHAAPGSVGRGVGALGRGMEAAGTSAPARAAGGFGVMESALRMDPKGIVLAAAPKALEYGGQGLQAVGKSLEGLRRVAADPPVLDQPAGLNVGRTPDLMDQYTASLQKGAVPAGQPYLDDNGEVIGHTTDTNGSTGFQPIATPTASVGRALPRDWDALFGPQTGLGQAAEMKGDVGYDPANRGASWIDSPDVSNPDLRDFMSDPANPADQRGNAVKSYRQRQQFAQSPTGQQALAGLQAAAAPSYDATTELDPATIDTMAAQGAPTVQAMTDAGQLPGPGDAMRTNNVGTWGTMTDPMALSPAQWAELSNRVNNVWQPGAP